MQLDPTWLASPEYLPANSVTYAQAKVMLAKVVKGGAISSSLLDPYNMYLFYENSFINKKGYPLGMGDNNNTDLTYDQTKAFGVYL